MLGFLSLASMMRGFPVEDRLDGASNYGSWKPRVLLALEEYDVIDFAVETLIHQTERFYLGKVSLHF